MKFSREADKMFHSGRHLLVVEDEPLISLMIENMADDLGWLIVGSAYTELEALDLLETSTPTLALLDIKLGSTTSFGVARACRERGIPIVFTTGYTAANIPRECADVPILAKPFSQADFETALQRGLNQTQDRTLFPAQRLTAAGERAL